jgi:hypothetical protein
MITVEGGPSYHREGAPSKLVLLGWEFCFEVMACDVRMSQSGGVLAEFVSIVRESYRTTSPKHKKPGWEPLGVISRASGPGSQGQLLICAVDVRFQFGNLWTKMEKIPILVLTCRSFVLQLA